MSDQMSHTFAEDRDAARPPTLDELRRDMGRLGR